MSSLKQSLIIIMVVLISIRTIFAKHLCDYPFSDLPKQILAIGWLDLPEIYVVIAKDLTVYTIQMKDIYSHTKDTPISFVVLNETTLEDFWPKVYDNADFQQYKDGGFETPFWTEDKTITFVKSVDGATVVLVDGNSESLATATFTSEMDNPTDAYSNGHVWTQSVMIGYPNIPCVTFYQDEDNNHRFMRILYAYSQDHKNNRISVLQDFYMCKSNDSKRMLHSEEACGWTNDDAILVAFFEQNDAHLFLLAETQVYVIEGAFYEDSSFYTMNYNKFFNCGRPESTTTTTVQTTTTEGTNGSSTVSDTVSGTVSGPTSSPPSGNGTTAVQVLEYSTDKSGFPTVAIIIIVLVLVAFLIAVLVVVLLYCFNQSQDKRKRSSRKGKTSSSGLKASKLSKEPNSKNKLTSRRLNSKGTTSKRPTSKGPTSKGPTSKGPTSKRPTSKRPTSKGPTSKRPTSKGLTTKGPTSKVCTFSKKSSKRGKVLDSKAPESNLKGTSKGLSSTRRSNMKSKKKQSKTSRMQVSKMKFSKRK